MDKHSNTASAQSEIPRASGRVGANFKRSKMDVREQLKADEIFSLYRKLLNLHGQKESELSKAIAYGLKICGQAETDKGKKSRTTRHTFIN